MGNWLVDQAVREGVRQGFENAWTDVCEGSDDPEDRCPMDPQDGCACYFKAYHEAPFWRRWRMEVPRRPSSGAVLRAMFLQQIESDRYDRSAT